MRTLAICLLAVAALGSVAQARPAAPRAGQQKYVGHLRSFQEELDLVPRAGGGYAATLFATQTAPGGAVNSGSVKGVIVDAGRPNFTLEADESGSQHCSLAIKRIGPGLVVMSESEGCIDYHGGAIDLAVGERVVLKRVR